MKYLKPLTAILKMRLLVSIILLVSSLALVAQPLATSWKKKQRFNSTLYSSMLVVDGNHFLTFDDGVYRSTDHGKSFSKLEAFPLQKGQISNLKLYRYGNMLYAGKFEGGTCKLFTSTDYGTSWQTHTTTLSQTVTFSIPEWRIYGNTWFIVDATSGKNSNTYSFFYSTDAGLNWNVGDMGNYYPNGITYHLWLLDVAPVPNGYVGSTLNGIYFSNDLINWQQIESTCKMLLHQKHSSGADVIYASSGSIDQYASVMRLDVTTLQWANVYQGLDLGTDKHFAYYNDVAFASGSAGFYQSTDQGKSWQAVTPLSLERKLHKLHICGDEYLATTRTLTGGTVEPGLIKSSDAGFTWADVLEYNGLDKPFVTNFYKSADKLFGFGSGGIHVINGDQSYSIFPKYTLSFTISGNRYLASTTSGVYISDDEGVTWKRTFYDLAITVFASGEKVFMIKGGINNSFKPSTRFVSWDNGDTWVEDTSNAPLNSIGYFASLNNMLFAIGNQRLKSTDNGQSWTILSYAPNIGTPQTNIDVIGDKVFISSTKGVVLSKDEGNIWSTVFGDGASNVNAEGVVKMGDKYFCAHAKGLSWSSDGETWDSVTGMSADILPNQQFVYLTGIEQLNNKLYTSVNRFGDLWEVELTAPVTCKLISGSATGLKNQLIELPIKTENLKDVVALQFNVEWDPTIVTYAGITNPMLDGLDSKSFGITHVANGKLIVSWSSPSLVPVSPATGDPIFSIAFELSGNPGAATPVTINGPIEVIGKDMTLLGHQEIAGEITIKPDATFSGSITYNTSPFANAAIKIAAIENGDHLFIQTDDQGKYTQSVPAYFDYNLSVSKVADPATYLDYVDMADVALIQRHIIQTEIFTDPYKLIAADVNKNKSVTVFDKVLVEAVILGKQEFPNGEQWIFIPADFIFAANDLYTFHSSTVFPKVIEDVTQNFVAVHLGDVVQPQSTGRTKDPNEVLTLNLLPQYITENQLRIEVRGTDFKNLSALQAAFEIGEGLEFVDIEPKAITPMSNVVNNSLRVIWSDEDGKSKSIGDDEVLFKLYFNSSATETPLKDRIQISNSFNSKVFKSNLQNSNLKIQWTSSKPEHVGTEINGWHPNPFSNKLTTDIIVMEEQQVIVQVNDVKGRTIDTMQVPCSKGLNKITWAATDRLGKELPAGTYLITIIADKTVTTVKVVKE